MVKLTDEDKQRIKSFMLDPKNNDDIQSSIPPELMDEALQYASFVANQEIMKKLNRFAKKIVG